MKKFLDTLLLVLAIVVSASSLSGGAVASLYAQSETSSIQEDFSNYVIGKATKYYTNLTDQEPVTLDESETISFSFSDAPFYSATHFDQHSSMLSSASSRQFRRALRHPHHKFYLKNIVFPFHSFW